MTAVVLGDNSVDSSDSREWQLAAFQVNSPPYDGLELRGNLRRGENPRVVHHLDASLTFFRDEFGERHVFPRNEAERRIIGSAPYVPLEMISGRAFLVFWPLLPSRDVYRLKWIH